MNRPEPAFRCADAARERADPLAGSAPPAQRWLLLEHPGPWRIDAVAGAGIEWAWTGNWTLKMEYLYLDVKEGRDVCGAGGGTADRVHD